jgi:hypothetical protein
MDGGAFAKIETCSSGKSHKIDTTRGNVLTHGAGRDNEASCVENIMKFGM